MMKKSNDLVETAWGADMIQAMLLGVATGMRSTAGLGILVFTGRQDLPGPLRRRPAAPVAALVIGSELVVDKLPSAPSRLEPPGLITRAVLAGVAAAVVPPGTRPARAARISAAMIAAVVSAKVAHDLRARLARRWPDAVCAVVEDVVALTTAKIGATPSPRVF
jgi:uncharacterized membrane protein